MEYALAATARSRLDREERMGVVSEIHAWNRGRELQRLRLKYAEMETDAFSFFRGTAHLFFRDWPLDTALDDAPLVWVCGDLHLENFGSFPRRRRTRLFRRERLRRGRPRLGELGSAIVAVR
jgi:uncharacterized protein (DUF2252 family)